MLLLRAPGVASSLLYLFACLSLFYVCSRLSYFLDELAFVFHCDGALALSYSLLCTWLVRHWRLLQYKPKVNCTRSYASMIGLALVSDYWSGCWSDYLCASSLLVFFSYLPMCLHDSNLVLVCYSRRVS